MRGRRSATRPSTATSTAPKASGTACTAPAQGAPPARVPLRPKAARRLHPARALDRKPSGGGPEPGELRALGGRPADLPEGGRQGQRDLAGRAEEPLHLPAGQRRQAHGGGDRRHRRRAPAAARGRPPDGHLRPRDRVRRLSRARPRARRGQLLLRPALPLAEGWCREPERPRPALPAAREPARGARAGPAPPPGRPAQRYPAPLPRLPHPARGLPAAPGGPDRPALLTLLGHFSPNFLILQGLARLHLQAAKYLTGAEN